MTIISAQKTLDAIRAEEDGPVASVHGYDVSGNLNAQHEILLGEKAQGAGSITQVGHMHDHNGAGIGILRSGCGAFQIVGGPLTHNPSAPTTQESFATGRGATQYPTHIVGPGGFQMGVAYASPGVESIKVAFQVKSSLVTPVGYIQIHNITDNLYSATQTPTQNPAWYTLAVPVTAPGGGALRRFIMDIYCVRGGSAETFSLYAAFPFEYQGGTL